MHCSVLSMRRMDLLTNVAWLIIAMGTGVASMHVPAGLAQSSYNEQSEVDGQEPVRPEFVKPFKKAQYAGTALLIHLPTNTARALVMPEPVRLQGEPAQMPGVELAFEGDVVGFFARQEFARRLVSFVGLESGVEYQLRIRASKDGIAEPLEIVR